MEYKISDFKVSNGVVSTPFGNFEIGSVLYYQSGAIKGLQLTDFCVESIWFNPDGGLDQIIQWDELI